MPNTVQPNFSVSTINPVVVIGPPVYLPSSGSQLNETLKPFYDVFSGTVKEIGPNIGSGSFVDVRDVAFMHIWAFENASKADGERYIACRGFGPLQGVADILNEEYKKTAIGEKIAVGSPGEGYVGYNKEKGKVENVLYLPEKPRADGSKAAREMGFKYIDFPQSVVDTAKALEPLL